MSNPPEGQDILEFVDTTGYDFLGSVSLVIAIFTTAFRENPNVVSTDLVPNLDQTKESNYAHDTTVSSVDDKVSVTAFNQALQFYADLTRSISRAIFQITSKLTHAYLDEKLSVFVYEHFSAYFKPVEKRLFSVYTLASYCVTYLSVSVQSLYSVFSIPLFCILNPSILYSQSLYSVFSIPLVCILNPSILYSQSSQFIKSL